ncbi:DUF1778 domain-containing protein [Spirulina sp. CCNP1310]|uniref:type II toxin-antitoxin system TacA family antitoxin n=1 Tax=Spirulina sp. CCNP1310 TaxID=3110249 RepID=UPI002B20422F|nr:DUF1778 domain-containing protein [Spirulina sp. CCNP1310]MEA5421569.1 DUF1778 domain-containing protein [Spirulina sp. CCNP1310]
MAPSPSARLEARISPETKALIQRAADLQGKSLKDFTVTILEAEAYKIIERHQTLKLSCEDSEAFINALINPPEPNPALKSAVAQYNQSIAG